LAQEPVPKDPYKKESVQPVIEEQLPENSNVDLTFEQFSLSISDAAALLRGEANDSDRFQRVMEMVAAGKARQEKLVVLRTKSGQRAVVESSDEVRYAAQYGLPDFGSLDSRAIKGGDAKEKSRTPAPPLQPTDPEVLYKDQIAKTGVIAKSFETRNVGETVELEPVIGPNGRTIDLNFIPQLVRYIGERETSPEKNLHQPIFETQKITTSISLQAGKPFLIGTMNPPADNGIATNDSARRIWLFFATAHVVGSDGVAHKTVKRGER
jgi:hypothetical protein